MWKLLWLLPIIMGGLYYQRCNSITTAIETGQIVEALEIVNTTQCWCPLQIHQLIQYIVINREYLAPLISILRRFGMVWQEHTLEALSQTAGLDQIITDHRYVLAHGFDLTPVSNSLTRYCFNLEICQIILSEVNATPLERPIRRKILELVFDIELMAQYYDPRLSWIVAQKCNSTQLLSKITLRI